MPIELTWLDRHESATMRLEVDLRSGLLAAVVSGLAGAPPLTRVNPRLVSLQDQPRVLLWARRVLATGTRVAWLTAEELAALP